MKLSKKLEGRRTPPPLAREMLRQPEEPDFKFDPKVHLTERDWVEANRELEIYKRENNPVGGLGLLFFEKMMRAVNTHAEPLAGLNQTTREWLQQYYTMHPEHIVKNLNTERPVDRKIQAKLYGRNLFPNQAEFSVDVNDLDQLIKASYDGGAQFFSVLQIEFFRKQCPEQHPTKPIRPEFQLTPVAVQGAIELIKGSLHLTDDTRWITVVYQIVMLRVADPQGFDQLRLDQAFWKKAVNMLTTMRKHFMPTFAFYKYAYYLTLLAADELKLDAKGNLVLEQKPKKVGETVPLPVRDTT